jgi:hypothetical protein
VVTVLVTLSIGDVWSGPINTTLYLPLARK